MFQTVHPALEPRVVAKALLTAMQDRPLPEGLRPVGLAALLDAAVAADLAYLSGLGDAPYDDDDAFEAIADPLVRRFCLEDEAEQDACAWVDDYMEAMAEYLEENHLIDWS